MERKKKILILAPLPPPHMGPTLASRIILESKLKDEFTLIHLDTSDHRELSHLNKIDFRNVFLAIKDFIVLFWLIITKKPDLVYIPICQTAKGYIRDSAYILLSRIYGRKVICHLRGGNFRNWYNASNALIRWYIRSIHSLVDGQIVLGKKLANLFHGIVSQNKVYIVPNGKSDQIHYKRRYINDKTKIIYLSNMKRTKGLFDVLAAVPEVYKVFGKKVEFIFAGKWTDNETKKDFEEFYGSHNFLPIHVTGPVYGRNRYHLLLSSDIFVFTPIEEEGHPWVIIEAMIAGLPIISTDQGAITESVIDGKNGFIVGKKNPSQIAEKINYLIDNPEIRRKMGEESRRLYLENFTEDKMIERLSHAFNSVLKN